MNLNFYCIYSFQIIKINVGRVSQSLRNILFISYFFPPLGGPGVQRSGKFCKYLPEYGWNPIVVTVKDIAYVAYDNTLENEIAGIDVHRTDSLDMMRVLHKLEQCNFSRKHDTIYTKTSSQRKQFFRGIFPIDSKVGWIPFAVHERKKIYRTHKLDAIYCSVGPFSSAIVGYVLSRKFNIPLIVDYRDLFRGKPDASYFTSWHERYAYKWEKKVLDRAHAVIINTHRAKERIQNLFPSIEKQKFFVIYNGYDKEDFPQISRTQSADIVFTYTGGFYGERTPKCFLQALAELEDLHQLPENVKFQFVGNLPVSIRKLFHNSGFMKHIILSPQVSHKESINYIMQSDFLLLFIAKIDSEIVIPAKLFEYLAAKRPILSMIPKHGEAAHIIEKFSAGLICEPDDVQKIKENILEMIKYKQLGIINEIFPIIENNYSAYERRNLTKKLVDVLNNLV
ncbi:glycosyltransferase [bacterium]|nr:MAG: glycosyltransferase [bacterium]